MSAGLVADSATLSAHLDHWRGQPWLAVDTEFVRVDTYAAKLCLVQVAGPDARAACVDALALDPAPLQGPLFDAAVTKVLHAAGQDLEIFVQHTGDCPRPLFDTQVAAALLGQGEQIGYAALVQWRLGVAVDKSLSRFDWSQRPLPKRALDYAADDVRHLAQLYPALRAELESRGRLPWLAEECARLADPARYTVDSARAWRWVRGLGRLDAAAQHRAAGLAAWREEEARRADRPRRWILEDEVLLRIAARDPATAQELEAVEGVPRRIAQRAGNDLLRALRESASGDPLVAEVRLSAAQKQKIRTLSEHLRRIAEREQVAATLVATRSDLEALVREGEASGVPLLRGWRRDLAGAELLAAI